MTTNEEEDDDMESEEVDLHDLVVARVDKTELKALLCDFQMHAEELGHLHKTIRETDDNDLPVATLKEWMLEVTRTQTLMMTGIATLLQNLVNQKDDFNED